MMVKRSLTESHSSSLRSIHLADANRLGEAFSSFAKAASRRSHRFSIVSENISSHPTLFEGLCKLDVAGGEGLCLELVESRSSSEAHIPNKCS